jgi:hypothetical protein
MSYYPLSAIEQCLPVEQERKWADEAAFDIPKILNLEFYKIFGLAISVGAIKTYSASGRLVNSATNLSLQTFLNEKEVSAWLKAEKLPYSWRPEKIKPKSLENLLGNGELKTDCVDMAHELRARGIPAEHINRSKVAEELYKTPRYRDYQKDTLEHRIRAGWWKAACSKEDSKGKS